MHLYRNGNESMFDIAILNGVANACERRGIDIGTLTIEDVGKILDAYFKCFGDEDGN